MHATKIGSMFVVYVNLSSKSMKTTIVILEHLGIPRRIGKKEADIMPKHHEYNCSINI